MLNEKDGKETVVINEAAVKAFGWDKPIGKTLRMGVNEVCTVKGVIRDIYYNAPVHPVTPAVFFLPESKERGGFHLQIQRGDMERRVAEIERRSIQRKSG